MGNIADGMLLDVLRKLACFGIHLVKLDIRQGWRAPRPGLLPS